jgi:hypothetical protein
MPPPPWPDGPAPPGVVGTPMPGDPGLPPVPGVAGEEVPLPDVPGVVVPGVPFVVGRGGVVGSPGNGVPPGEVFPAPPGMVLLVPLRSELMTDPPCWRWLSISAPLCCRCCCNVLPASAKTAGVKRRHNVSAESRVRMIWSPERIVLSEPVSLDLAVEKRDRSTHSRFEITRRELPQPPCPGVVCSVFAE